MKAEKGIVYIVDDDVTVLFSLSKLLQARGLEVRTFEAPLPFLSHVSAIDLDHLPPVCVILDLVTPGIDGIETLQRLRILAETWQVILITSNGDIPTSVRAMKEGACDFLEKPLDGEGLLAVVGRAFRKHIELKQRREMVVRAGRRVAALTPRERIVMQYMIAGFLSKQIGGMLGISEGTVKIHRSRIMEKTGVYSITDLVRLAQTAGVAPASAG